MSAYGTDKGPAASARLAATLAANHPGIDLAEMTLDAVLPPGLVDAGLLVGTPAPAWPEAADDPAPIDRFIRGMRETVALQAGAAPSWALVVAAERMDAAEVAKRLAAVLAELRNVADQDRGNQPIAAHYAGLLQALAGKITRGRATSLWSVSVTVAANDPEQVSPARSALRAPSSLPAKHRSPIRCGRSDQHAAAAPLPLWRAAAGRHGRRLLPRRRHQSLYADELAGLVAVPRLERIGFEVRNAPRFKQATQTAKTPLQLGEILERGQAAGADYALDLPRLASHALIAGASGSGKTNTVFHILRQVAHAGIPSSSSSRPRRNIGRSPRSTEIGAALAVYTLGDDGVAAADQSVRGAEGTLVQTHLDRLKAVFDARSRCGRRCPRC